MITPGEHLKKSMEADLALCVMVFFFLQTAVLIPFLILINDVKAGKSVSQESTSGSVRKTPAQENESMTIGAESRTYRLSVKGTTIRWEHQEVSFDRFLELSTAVRPEDRIVVESDESLLARAVRSLGRRGIGRIELAYPE